MLIDFKRNLTRIINLGAQKGRRESVNSWGDGKGNFGSFPDNPVPSCCGVQTLPHRRRNTLLDTGRIEEWNLVNERRECETKLDIHLGLSPFTCLVRLKANLISHSPRKGRDARGHCPNWS